jgi:hypothetical protein
MMTIKTFSTIAVPVALAVSLSACGSSSSSSDPLVAGTDIPVSATQTVPGVVSFANLSAAASSGDTSEPLAVGDVSLATSDTDEPDPSV